MWKKIISNRDPRDTIYSELKKEFSPYVRKASSFSRVIAERYPKCLFTLMTTLMVVSTALSFTVFRHHEPDLRAVQVRNQSSRAQDGFTQILITAGEIRQTLYLKHLVDSITAKKQLNQADSIVLDSALSHLQRMHNYRTKGLRP